MVNKMKGNMAGNNGLNERHRARYLLFKIFKQKEASGINLINYSELTTLFMKETNRDFNNAEEFEKVKNLMRVHIHTLKSKHLVKKKGQLFSLDYGHPDNKKYPINRINFIWDLLQKTALRRGWMTDVSC